MVTCILEFIDEYLGLIISLIAVIFTYFQIKAFRKHFRTSLKPMLVFTLYPGNIQGSYMGVKIKNCGTGPAVIISYCISIDGKNFTQGHHEIQDFMMQATQNPSRFGDDEYEILWMVLAKGSVIGIQEEILLFHINEDKKRPGTLEFYEKFLRLLQIFVEYESFYGEINEHLLKSESDYKRDFDEAEYKEFIKNLELADNMEPGTEKEE